ncbi:CapA family protein [Paenibacillus endoradicis]|uniref:CapA family protein n=1 Tax=Paenibacillus endoradicis TaxID=2972487 RepID=UPI0021592945|nr:CapA family protein [Paenibacillus endoradicis]MCR8660668.1 CapA family protein [Paenibacillus endoradicis]
MSSRSSLPRRRLLWLINGILLVLISIAIIAFFVIINSYESDVPSISNTPIGQVGNDSTDEPTIVVTPSPSPTPEPTPTLPEYTDATWIGVGDIMSHTPQLPGAYNKATDTYDFNPFFEPITSLLEDGNWIMANLETPIAGSDIGYTGYPTFNAPTELAEALWNAGFNVLSTANNHSLDKGEKGILRTLENVHNIGFTTVGTAASIEDSDATTIIEHNDISMGFLSYTYGTNGIPIPSGKDYLVNLIDKDTIIADMNKLREDGAEVITIALHFGNEYQSQPSEQQKTLARELIAAGADIIAGSHPHVLQPYEMLSIFDEDGNERQGLIIYSMGNFISNQRGESKDYGAIYKVNIRKHYDTGAIELTNVEVTPTWVHRYKPDAAYRYRILPVAATLETRDDPLLSNKDYDSLESNLMMLNERLTSMQATEQ